MPYSQTAHNTGAARPVSLSTGAARPVYGVTLVAASVLMGTANHLCQPPAASCSAQQLTRPSRNAKADRNCSGSNFHHTVLPTHPYSLPPPRVTSPLFPPHPTSPALPSSFMTISAQEVAEMESLWESYNLLHCSFTAELQDTQRDLQELIGKAAGQGPAGAGGGAAGLSLRTCSEEVMITAMKQVGGVGCGGGNKKAVT